MAPRGRKIEIDEEWVDKLDALVEPIQAKNPAFKVNRTSVHRIILQHGYDAVVRDLTADGLME